MNQFSCVVEDTFNITGRGTIFAVIWNREGSLTAGDTLLTSDKEELFVRGIEMTKPLNNRLGILVKMDYEKSKSLIGKTLTKQEVEE